MSYQVWIRYQCYSFENRLFSILVSIQKWLANFYCRKTYRIIIRIKHFRPPFELTEHVMNRLRIQKFSPLFVFSCEFHQHIWTTCSLLLLECNSDENIGFQIDLIRLVGWLVGRLVGGWVVGWLWGGWLVGWLVSCWIGWLVVGWWVFGLVG